MSRTYRNILIIVIAVSGLVTTLSNGILYVRFQETNLAAADEANRQNLRRQANSIRFNVRTANEFLVNQFLDSRNRILMLSRSENEYAVFDTQEILVRMWSSVRDNAMIHSLVLYNPILDRLYSTAGTTLEEDIGLHDLFISPDSSQNVVPRVLAAESYLDSVPVFTFIVRERGNDGAPWCAAAINVRRDAVFRNLAVAEGSGSTLRIFGADFALLGSESGSDLDEASLVALRGAADGAASGSLVVGRGASRRVLSYLRLEQPDWIIVQEDPYDAVFAILGALRRQTAAVLVAAFIASILLSTLASRVIYRPLGRLVAEARAAFDPNGIRPKDDDAYLSEFIKRSAERVRSLESYKLTADSFLRRNLIRATFLGSVNEAERRAGLDVLEALFERRAAAVPAIVELPAYGDPEAGDRADGLAGQAGGYPGESLLDAVELSEGYGLLIFAADGKEAVRALLGAGESGGSASGGPGPVLPLIGEPAASGADLARGIAELLGCLRADRGPTAGGGRDRASAGSGAADAADQDAAASAAADPDRLNSVLVDSVMDYIRARFADPNLSLKLIASDFRMSADYLGKVFRQKSGRSVADSITELRLAITAERLAASDAGIGPVMAAAGFTNESHYYRAFKQRYGMTPREYRLRAVTATIKGHPADGVQA